MALYVILYSVCDTCDVLVVVEYIARASGSGFRTVYYCSKVYLWELTVLYDTCMGCHVRRILYNFDNVGPCIYIYTLYDIYRTVQYVLYIEPLQYADRYSISRADFDQICICLYCIRRIRTVYTMYDVHVQYVQYLQYLPDIDQVA
jgi:hypothetical protein